MSRPEPVNPVVSPASPDRESAPPPSPRRPRRPCLARKRFWLALFLTTAVSLPLYPPAWHAALRTWLGWQAQRHGCEVAVGRIEGGILDTTQLYDLRWRQGAPLPSPEGASTAEGTDLTIARADLTLAWTVPWFQQAAPSWVRKIVLDGVSGQWDLGALGRAHLPPAPAIPRVENHGLAPAAISGDSFTRLLASVFPSLDGWSARLVPQSFGLRADDLRLLRGRYRLRATGLRLSGSRDDAGLFLAREVQIAGPGFENTLTQPHAETYWKGSRLTISQLNLATGLTLVRATLDGAHLDRHRLDWEGQMAALGGEVRGQGSVNFSRERIALEVAATFQNAAVPPLARLLGIEGPADGVIDQGNLTFRGDPENWPAAEMWLAAHSRDLRWGKREWEDLELRAVVVNRRVQVHRLELRQSGNRVSLTGECPLPAAPPVDGVAPRPWREGGFSCQIDARLDDLRSLSDLFAPHVPALDGRMSVNGRLTARPGARQDIDGYLNVEGTRLTLNGAPLDYLRSTLTFKDGGLRVADLQATHDTDYFTGTGSMRLDGPPRYEGEGHAEVRHLSVYTPALEAASPALLETLSKVNALSAQWRWDDSVVRFEQCQGKLDDAPFAVGGTVDLRDTAQPVMDLSLDAEHLVVRRVEGQEPVRADCALTLRGQLGNLPVLGGDVRLLGGGSLGLRLEMFSLPEGQSSEESDDLTVDEQFLSMSGWLPNGWQSWCLDLDVSAESGNAVVAPELHIASSGEDDTLDISGRIDLRKAPLTADGSVGEADGSLYFYGDPGDAPEVSLTAKMIKRQPAKMKDKPSPGKQFAGPATRLREVLEASDAPPDSLRLAEGTEAATERDNSTNFGFPIADDATPWSAWLTTRTQAPATQEFALRLR